MKSLRSGQAKALGILGIVGSSVCVALLVLSGGVGLKLGLVAIMAYFVWLGYEGLSADWVAIDGEDLESGGAQCLGVPAAPHRGIHRPVCASGRGEDRGQDGHLHGEQCPLRRPGIGAEARGGHGRSACVSPGAASVRPRPMNFIRSVS